MTTTPDKTDDKPEANAWAVMDESGKVKAGGRSKRVLIATDKSARAFGPGAEDLGVDEMLDLATVAMGQACGALPPGARFATVSAALSQIQSAGAGEDRAEQLRVPTVPVVLDMVRDLVGDEAHAKVQDALRDWMARKG